MFRKLGGGAVCNDYVSALTCGGAVVCEEEGAFLVCVGSEEDDGVTSVKYVGVYSGEAGEGVRCVKRGVGG